MANVQLGKRKPDLYEGNEDIYVLAKQEVGNHLKFDSFGWYCPPWDDDNMGGPHDWAMYYTRSRDSRLIDQSNHAYIKEAMKPYEEDGTAIDERHGCSMAGWHEGFAIRIYKQGKVTDAFKIWMNIEDAVSGYPLLDEEDHSNREYDATLDNIKYIASDVRDDAPEGWEGEVYRYLSDYHDNALEPRDDQGGWPDEELVQEALQHLRYLDEEEPDINSADPEEREEAEKLKRERIFRLNDHNQIKLEL
jgi:hypothetical protein